MPRVSSLRTRPRDSSVAFGCPRASCSDPQSSKSACEVSTGLRAHFRRSERTFGRLPRYGHGDGDILRLPSRESFVEGGCIVQENRTTEGCRKAAQKSYSSTLCRSRLPTSREGPRSQCLVVHTGIRSEERRVGQDCVSTCNTRW